MHFLVIVAVVISISLANARPDVRTYTGPTGKPLPLPPTCSQDLCFRGLPKMLIPNPEQNHHFTNSNTNSPFFFSCGDNGMPTCRRCPWADGYGYGKEEYGLFYNEFCDQCLRKYEDDNDICSKGPIPTASAPACGLTTTQLRNGCDSNTCKNGAPCGYWGLTVNGFEYSVNCGAHTPNLHCEYTPNQWWDNYKQCAVIGVRPPP